MIKELPISQLSLVAQLCPTICDPMNHSTPGLPVHHQLPEFTQTNVHQSLFLVSCYLSFPFSSAQFSSVTQSCLTLWDPMDCRMPGLPVHHQLPEFTQTHVYQVCDAIQPSHPVIPFSSHL